MDKDVRFMSPSCFMAFGTEPELDAMQAKIKLKQLSTTHSKITDKEQSCTEKV